MPPTAAPVAAPLAPEVTNACLQSVPDPGTTAPVAICYTLFKPAGASRTARVPMVLHSHGWGGSRTTDPASFAYLLDAGFGVLSFDQRGWGESGGQAQIENPDYEGKDVQKVVDVVARLDWVAKESRHDPVLGAIGGSYGGGYQLVGAFSELRDRGKTRFDALVPEITWNSLTESLFPQGVPRTLWAAALIAAALPSDALPPLVVQGFLESTVTGNVSQSLYDFLGKNGPAWHVGQGRRLNLPVLFGQGGTDNLFPLSEGHQELQHHPHAAGPPEEHARRLQRRPHPARAAAARHQRPDRPRAGRRLLARARQRLLPGSSASASCSRTSRAPTRGSPPTSASSTSPPPRATAA